MLKLKRWLETDETEEEDSEQFCPRNGSVFTSTVIYELVLEVLKLLYISPWINFNWTSAFQRVLQNSPWTLI
jgi:hypothetical protein